MLLIYSFFLNSKSKRSLKIDFYILSKIELQNFIRILKLKMSEYSKFIFFNENYSFEFHSICSRIQKQIYLVQSELF